MLFHIYIVSWSFLDFQSVPCVREPCMAIKHPCMFEDSTRFWHQVLFSMLFSTVDSTPSMYVGFLADHHSKAAWTCCGVIFNVIQTLALTGSFRRLPNRRISGLCRLAAIFFNLWAKKKKTKVPSELSRAGTMQWKRAIQHTSNNYNLRAAVNFGYSRWFLFWLQLYRKVEVWESIISLAVLDINTLAANSTNYPAFL